LLLLALQFKQQLVQQVPLGHLLVEVAAAVAAVGQAEKWMELAEELLVEELGR
jgi:hypothetical protein